MSARRKTTKARKAWAIVDWHGNIQLDKVMATRAEAWGLLSDERQNEIDKTFSWKAQLEAMGYKCVRVSIGPA